MPSPHDDLLETAVRAARAGARVLNSYFRKADLAVESKGLHDYVSRADKESEAAILGVIHEAYPDHRILAEESGRTDGESEGSAYGWYVDPLDGTTNFLHGLPVFCISIGCRKGDELVAAVILDPVGDELFTATRGGGASWNGRPMRTSDRDGLHGAYLATGYPWQARGALDEYLAAFRDVFLAAKSVRRCGAAALDLAYTAAGVYDGFFEFRLSPWDIAAGILLVEEAGGVVSDLDGGRAFLRGGNVVAAGARLHGELLATVSRHADETVLDRLAPRQTPRDGEPLIAPPPAPAAGVLAGVSGGSG